MPRKSKPTQRGQPPAASDYSDDAKTRVYDSNQKRAGTAPPVADASGSQPIRAISMKTPADANAPVVEKREREMPHVRLRAMSEVAPARQPQNLGNLAPPYDPSTARNSSIRSYVMWGCLGVMLAAAIAVGVWFVGT